MNFQEMRMGLDLFQKYAINDANPGIDATDVDEFDEEGGE